ncbi:MAG TPA: DUF881 domain-containing protein [Motilibacterales bacterium]|nr:DUF881 domain-containing protein [Motilibacterales bacterium]
MHSPLGAPDPGPGDAARLATVGIDVHEPATSAYPADARPRRRRRRVRWPDLVAGAVFAIAGAMFIASATASEDGILRLDRTGGLRDAITARAEQNTGVQDEVNRLTAQVAALQALEDPGTALDATNEQIAALSPVVGLTEVRGPGVTVTLDDADAPNPIPDGLTGDDYIVHQQDVQGVVNALWRSGASGVTVMGQRLINTSAVRCVGNTVILQGRVYSPPFVIEGVGDVERMAATLEEDESVRFFREWAAYVGMRYAQAVSRELVLPAYTGPLVTDDAQVVR